MCLIKSAGSQGLYSQAPLFRQPGRGSSGLLLHLAFIITLKGLRPWVWPQWIDGSGERSLVHPIWGWVAHPHSTVDWHTRWHIHTNTQTHTNTYMYKQTHRDKYQNTHTMKYLNTNNTPQTPNNKSSSRTDRKWLLQLWFSCESKLVTLHSH